MDFAGWGILNSCHPPPSSVIPYRFSLLGLVTVCHMMME
uniref:Uncharacterized protein n=1 Tax=Anguilla anguilla TaxID=7936 RepID=A0A0E9TU83_ANGAN